MPVSSSSGASSILRCAFRHPRSSPSTLTNSVIATVGAELAAEPAEDDVGDVLHRREDDRLLRVESPEAVVGRGQGWRDI